MQNVQQVQQVQQQSVRPTKPPSFPKKPNNRSLYLAGCAVIFVLMIASGVAGAYIGNKYFPSGEEGTTEENGEEEPTNGENGEEEVPDGDGTGYDEGIIKVTSPTSGQEVTGKIFVEGEASDFLEELTIKVYDDDWNAIAEDTAALEDTDTDTLQSWSIFSDVYQSPTSLTGKVRVFPTERGEKSKLTKTVDIRFQSIIAPGRIKLFAPLKFQVMQGGAVTFRGQMQDFLEGTMGVRILDENEKLIYQDNIEASGDNYGKYSHFEKSVEYKVDLSYLGPRGTWEIYEIDVEGQAGNVVLSVPVRFPER